jgi:hypothetical protein
MEDQRGYPLYVPEMKAVDMSISWDWCTYNTFPSPVTSCVHPGWRRNRPRPTASPFFSRSIIHPSPVSWYCLGTAARPGGRGAAGRAPSKPTDPSMSSMLNRDCSSAGGDASAAATSACGVSQKLRRPSASGPTQRPVPCRSKADMTLRQQLKRFCTPSRSF